MSIRTILLGGLLLALAAGIASAAQTTITRPIRMIVPYVPGGGTDTAARLVAPAISAAFGQQVIVDNRPGGSSMIGTALVARATPDGHTIGMVDAAFVTNPSLFDKLPYDTMKDFAPIALVASAPLILLVHPTVPAKNVKELVALAKSQPGKLTFGTAGNGTATHLAAEQFRVVAGIDLVHVPYKGAGQSITELLGGQITMAFTVQSTGRQHAESGRLRALAITSQQRSAGMPGLQTFAEAGYPAVDTMTVTGLIAPAGTPRDYVQKVSGIVRDALRSREVSERFQGLGYDTVGTTPDEYSALIRTEIAKWQKIIRAAGIKVADQ